MKLHYKYIGFYFFSFVLALPIPLIYSAIALGLMVINSLLLIKSFNYRLSKWTIICLVFVFSDLLRSLFFENLSIEGFDETRASFLFIPILFYNLQGSLTWQKRNILLFFVAGVLVYVLYAIGYMIYFYQTYTNYTFNVTDHYIIFMLYNYLPGAYHHTYIGIYMAFSIILLISELYHLKKLYTRLLVAISLFLIFSMQVYIGSKMTMVISVLSVMLYFFFTEKSKKRLKIVIVSLISFSAVLTYIIKDWLIISIKNSFGHRVEYLLEAKSIIINNFWFGIGLNNIKRNQIIIDGESKSLIPHNLYVHDFLSNGIIGFVLILFIFYYLYRKALSAKDISFLTFVFICFLLGLTEDFLYLQRGVFFFIFFTSLFLNSKQIIE